MTQRYGSTAIGWLLLLAATAAAQQAQQPTQNQDWRAGQPPVGTQLLPPNQPVLPQGPVLQQRIAPNQPLQAPFVLTPAEGAQLDRILSGWEEAGKHIRNFKCNFDRFEYDPVYNQQDPNKPKSISQGEINFGAPDKGHYSVENATPPERWICNGESIFEFDYVQKKLVEHKLPPELRGKAISDGPLPFIFGASAEKLKNRYFLRTITPAESMDKEIWLQAYPKFQGERANFEHAELILSLPRMQPTALQMHYANKGRTVHRFKDIVINDPLILLKGNPFAAKLPASDWRMEVEQAPTTQAARDPGANR